MLYLILLSKLDRGIRFLTFLRKLFGHVCGARCDFQVGCSVSSTFYILPVPDLPVPIKMRGEQSEIITSSPYKHSLEISLGELSEPSPRKNCKEKVPEI